jgi:hypothetical protein
LAMRAGLASSESTVLSSEISSHRLAALQVWHPQARQPPRSGRLPV